MWPGYEFCTLTTTRTHQEMKTCRVFGLKRCSCLRWSSILNAISAGKPCMLTIGCRLSHTLFPTCLMTRLTSLGTSYDTCCMGSSLEGPGEGASANRLRAASAEIP